MERRDLRIVVPEVGIEYGRRVAAHLGLEPVGWEEREFEDGEHKARPLESVRGKDVYVVQSLHGDGHRGVNDRLVRLLFALATLRDDHARRVTAVVPHLAYGRKDRRTKPRDPLASRYIAQLFEATGVDCVMAMDAHNPAAFENAFRIPVEHMTAQPVLVAGLLRAVSGGNFVVMSPDTGGYKRAEAFRSALADAVGDSIGMGFLEKKRSGGAVSGDALVGDVAGRTVVLVDDLISTGGTLARAAVACRAAGAERVVAVATHGLFTPLASGNLRAAPIDHLFIADTVPPAGLAADLLADRVTVLDTTALVADTIQRFHDERPFVDPAEDYDG